MCAGAVTGRVRIGGSILTIFLFICVTQRQSSLEDIPLAAFEMGGLRFIAWAFLLTCFCSLPIMIADIALGRSTDSANPSYSPSAEQHSLLLGRSSTRHEVPCHTATSAYLVLLRLYRHLYPAVADD